MTRHMDTDRKAKILRGLVESNGKWVSPDEKIKEQIHRRRKIEKGFVQHAGEWITVEEKRNILHPPTQSPKAPVVNISTTYNMDKRTFQEHRHLHIDAQAATTLLAGKGPAALPDYGKYQITHNSSGSEPQPKEETVDITETPAQESQEPSDHAQDDNTIELP